MIHIVAVDETAATLDAMVLGLAPKEWCWVTQHRDLAGWSQVSVCLGTLHGRHPEWAAIELQLTYLATHGRVRYVPDRAGD